ncbi:MAG: ChaN family lipoprotein [Myxococcota bacterium]
MKALLIVLLAATCGGEFRTPETPEAVVRARSTPVQLLRGDGEPVGEHEMMADLATVRIVYLGERHSRATDHAMQNRILSELYERDSTLAVGFEMFQRPFQPVLNEWSAGVIDETNLRRESEWDARWGFDFGLYRPMLEFVRARHIPAWALNAEQSTTRAVGRGGLEALDAETRAALPELRLDNEAHRTMIERAITGGGEGDNPHGTIDEVTLDRIYTAQVIWDETMAATIDEALAEGPSRVVVLAGIMHVQSGLGIPARTQERSRRIVLPIDQSDVEAATEANPPLADYLWVVDPEDEIH